MDVIKAAALALLTAGSVPATTIAFSAVGTAGGQPVNAMAVFSTGTDTISVTINNNRSDPTSVVQAISDLLFTVNTGQNTGSITSHWGAERTVHANGTHTVGGTVATGWSLSTQGQSLYLNVLGTAVAPAHLILGPPNGSNLYSNADSSIAGNASNNPFLASGATFILNVPGVTEQSAVVFAQFSFGTTPGVTLNGIGGADGGIGVGDQLPIPEPGSAGLMLLSLAAIGYRLNAARTR